MVDEMKKSNYTEEPTAFALSMQKRFGTRLWER